jgi:dephospho-CoA kinase
MSSCHSPLLIGLTGGIGSGKSTVGQMLSNLGAFLIDADAIARRLTDAHGKAMPLIVDRFGPAFVDLQGPTAKQALEAIIHPLVIQETKRQTEVGLSQGFATLVFDIPLLVESGARWRQQIDRVLVIDCQVATQIQRVMARNALPQETIEKIIEAQAPRLQRLRAADWVIYNDQLSLAALQQFVAHLPLPTRGN